MQIKWSKRADQALEAAFIYGMEHFGEHTARLFYKKVKADSYLLATTPLMGGAEPLLAERQKDYHSFVVHKHYKLVYYLKGNSLYIVDFWDTRREPTKLARRIRGK